MTIDMATLMIAQVYATRRTIESTQMTQLSESDVLELLEDRVKFELYAAEGEFDSLKELDKSGSSISSSSATRISWEMKIECLLAHLIGSVDALLIRINDKLGLGLDTKKVNSGPGLSTIQTELRVKGYRGLLDPLGKAQTPPESLKPGTLPKLPGWLWTLKDLRNQGMHRKLIIIHVKVGLHEDLIQVEVGAIGIESISERIHK